MRVAYRPDMNPTRPWFAVRQVDGSDVFFACLTQAGAQAKIRQWEWDLVTAAWLASLPVRSL